MRLKKLKGGNEKYKRKLCILKEKAVILNLTFNLINNVS